MPPVRRCPWWIPWLALALGLQDMPRAAWADPGSGPPLTLTRGQVRTVSDVQGLVDALQAANEGNAACTLLLADGTYVLDRLALEVRCPGLVIRSASGRRDAVIVRGPDEGPQASVRTIFLVSANDVVIADLTLGYCRHHGVQVRGEAPFNVSGLRVHNCRLVNCNEQFIKGSSSDDDPEGATDGCIEYCLFEFTSGWAYQFYTGGIDIHKGVRWTVRDNLFRSIRTPAGAAGLAEHAIHFWKRCTTRPQDVVVERNWIVNCDRGIGFGLGSPEGGLQGGASAIRNNIVANDGAGPHTDVGIGLEHASDVAVDNNTVLIRNYWGPIEYRFAGSSNLVFRNNLVNRPIQRRDDAPSARQSHNLERVEAPWFRDPAAGDLRLTAAAIPAIDAGSSLEGFRHDIDGRTRPFGRAWDIGASELVPPVDSRAADPRPNVVIFLADDAGWGDYSASGNRQVSTPHIDSLARDGVSLDRFFVQPVCAPTRAEFLTGRYHPRSGVHGVSTGRERMDPGERTIADAFHAAGYATGAFGKWHNGSQWPYHPNARGFDEYYGHTSGHWGEYFDPPLERNGRMERARGYIADVCTDEALSFIERQQSRPFLCCLPFTTPHSPWAAPESDWLRFRDKPITQRATQPDQENVDHTRCALAMIENQDRNVGRVLRQLHTLGLAENTIVLYFSDNGPNTARWNGGMRGRKAGVDEGSVRSVCFLRWPARLPRGRTVRDIAGAIDLLPTLTALAGVPPPAERPLDGRDLSPLLLGPPGECPERLLFATWGGQVSVRTPRYRLDAAGRLYDPIDDPGQTRDLAPTEPEEVARLTRAVAHWRREMFGPEGRPTPDSGVDPRPISVGFPEFPVTMLPARDGEPRGGVKRSSSAPNCSYFVNWTNAAGHMVWNLDVRTAGRYDVCIDYTCPPEDAGSLIELSFNQNRLSGRVEPGWNPPVYENQDTLPRPSGESRMKEFRALHLGAIPLEPGRGPLTLRALAVPGRSVMDVRRVTLTLRPVAP